MGNGLAQVSRADISAMDSDVDQEQGWTAAAELGIVGNGGLSAKAGVILVRWDVVGMNMR